MLRTLHRFWYKPLGAIMYMKRQENICRNFDNDKKCKKTKSYCTVLSLKVLCDRRYKRHLLTPVLKCIHTIVCCDIHKNVTHIESVLHLRQHQCPAAVAVMGEINGITRKNPDVLHRWQLRETRDTLTIYGVIGIVPYHTILVCWHLFHQIYIVGNEDE